MRGLSTARLSHSYFVSYHIEPNTSTTISLNDLYKPLFHAYYFVYYYYNNISISSVTAACPYIVLLLTAAAILPHLR